MKRLTILALPIVLVGCGTPVPCDPLLLNCNRGGALGLTRPVAQQAPTAPSSPTGNTNTGGGATNPGSGTGGPSAGPSNPGKTHGHKGTKGKHGHHGGKGGKR